MKVKAEEMLTAVQRWREVGREHGWVLKAITLWVDDEGRVRDSVGIKREEGENFEPIMFIEEWKPDDFE